MQRNEPAIPVAEPETVGIPDGEPVPLPEAPETATV
jgi:hypothetical protein